MKENSPTIYNNSWGILGYPSHEKIEEYKNMPVGGFRKMVKNLSKKYKDKPLTPHTVWIEKKVTDIYLTSVIVSAVGSSQSFDIARSQQDQLVFNEEPNHKGVVSYSYHSYNPQRWE